MGSRSMLTPLGERIADNWLGIVATMMKGHERRSANETSNFPSESFVTITSGFRINSETSRPNQITAMAAN